MSALHPTLREAIVGGVVEGEVEGEEVEEEEEEGKKVEAGGEGEEEAEEEEGEEGKMKKYLKGKLSLQNQCLSLISLLIRSRARVPAEVQNHPITMVMMRRPNEELLRPKQRV